MITSRPSIHKLLEDRSMGIIDTHQFTANVLRSETIIQKLENCYDVRGHDGCVNAISFNESGTLLLTGSDDGTVRTWSVEDHPQSLEILTGHVSNVFAVNFLPFTNDRIVISGGNDGDVRVYDLEARQCRVFRHHRKKVLRLAPNRHMPNVFLSCSADGTVHMIDMRSQYADTHVERFDGTHNGSGINSDRASIEIRPQALGGGRMRSVSANRSDNIRDSLVIDYSLLPTRHHQANRAQTLYHIDTNPMDGNRFIVGSTDGLVREFDLRNTSQKSSDSYVNVFGLAARSYDSGAEVTGCCYSHDGREIVATYLSDQIYVFDTTINYEKDQRVDFFKVREKKRKRSRRSRSSDEDEGGAATGPSEDEEATGFSVLVQGPGGARVISLRELLSGGVGGDDDDQEGDEHVDEGSDEDGEDAAEEETSPKTYKQEYKGHVSFQTIKGCAFYGPKSEYVVSGSDDSRIFVWEKESARLARVLTGHDSVVNTVTPHPNLPLLATGGIDSYVKVWMPIGDNPDEDTLRQRAEQMERIAQGNEENIDRHDAFSSGDIFSMLLGAILGRGRRAPREDSDE